MVGKPDFSKLDPKDPKYIPERYDTYKHWMEAQKIPVFRGFFIEDINKMELGYWDLKGVNASFVILEGTGGTNDAYVCEIPPAGKSKPIRHMYEEMVYVTQGHGATTVWQPGGKKHTFEWGPGSLFAIPINAYYQHFNSSGVEPARYYAVTNCCFIMNLFHSADFIFGTDYVFKDRLDPESDSYFDGDNEIFGRFFMTTNFVPDLHNLKLADYSERGKGSTNMKFDLARQTMGAHISEFPVGTYKKAHKHGPGAHVIIVSGKGYSTLWPEGEEPKRYDWKAGSVVVPPDQWFHQHFNSGAEPARYLALRWNNWRFKSVMKNSGENGSTYTSVKLGGSQIEFEDEDPQVHRDFVAGVEASGARCQMCEYYPQCPKKGAGQSADALCAAAAK
ncbi:MAG TPA: cupin domain-containing protein [Alphaproteobacteria bacterium]|nr:cupin domain-containing protein [Alphaproteobacteria bacterium]